MRKIIEIEKSKAPCVVEELKAHLPNGGCGWLSFSLIFLLGYRSFKEIKGEIKKLEPGLALPIESKFLLRTKSSISRVTLHDYFLSARGVVALIKPESDEAIAEYFRSLVELEEMYNA